VPVAVPTYLRRESKWLGPTPERFRLVPNKPPLIFENQPFWHEFIIIRLLEQVGWEGVWVKNWGGRAFWTDVGKSVDCPPHVMSIFTEITEKLSGVRGGCWDVMAWNDEKILFVESKQRGKDRLRSNQIAWLEKGLSISNNISFAIAEYQK
jgi:hypothetical protein